MPSDRAAFVLTAALLAALPLAAAHGDERGMDHSAATGTSNVTTPHEEPLNYFRYPHHAAWMYSHIALMLFGWAMVLPIAIVLSVARSRYHLPAQVVFHIFNGLGVFAGFVYNQATPDLYVTNSHHPIGWAVTSITIVWTIWSLYVAYSQRQIARNSAAGHSINAETMASYQSWHAYSDEVTARQSRDSGQGTERNSSSLMGSRHDSSESIPRHKSEPSRSPSIDDEHHHDSDNGDEKHDLLGNKRLDRFVSRHVGRFTSQRAASVIRFSQIVLEKFLLLLGFLAIATGFITWTGVFQGRQVFSGAAHFVKGGIFFWYGLLTLGRWIGAFTEFGWAWNVRPPHPLVARWKTRVPSAEFVESFVIWLYGASNVFLEHMNNWGQGWSAQDFQHVSITLLFFGGGLLGMVLESRTARDLLNTSVVEHEQRHHTTPRDGNDDEEGDEARLWTPPPHARTPLNPLPALVVLLLGIAMGAHHQDSMLSTMLHLSWGRLLSGFALARLATYLVLYSRPPASHYPARPPTEVVAAFCLTAGGWVFMLSAHGTVVGIEAAGVGGMAVVMVVMGASAVVLAWEVLVLAVKGWAVRREGRVARSGVGWV